MICEGVGIDRFAPTSGALHDGDDEARHGVEDFGRLARARTPSRAL